MKNVTTKTALFAALLSMTLGVAMPIAFAHSNESHEMHGSSEHHHSDDESDFGKPGNPTKATRTIAVDMTDAMRFGPSAITVKQGETIRFVVTNKGKVAHEMVLGTLNELKEHGEMMRMHPDMVHEDPSSVRVQPGAKEEMVWQFTQPGQFYFGCLIPGHFEAGMVGKLKVKKG